MNRRVTLADVPPDAIPIPYGRWRASLPITAFYDPDDLQRHRDKLAIAESDLERRGNTPPSQKKRRTS